MPVPSTRSKDANVPGGTYKNIILRGSHLSERKCHTCATAPKEKSRAAEASIPRPRSTPIDGPMSIIFSIWQIVSGLVEGARSTGTYHKSCKGKLDDAGGT